jgi:AcrR family transcriptional regulator
MGRPARVFEADLLEGAARIAAKFGPAQTTIARIARETKAPVGSIYHRYPSRDALLAEVWLAAAARFQAALLALLAKAASEDDAVQCALLTPRFAREDHAGAVVLIAHRRDDFLHPDLPETYRERAAKLAADMRAGLAAAAPRLLAGDPRGREKLAVALIGIPLGAVRIFLPQAVPPREIDAAIAAAVRAALRAKPG